MISSIPRQLVLPYLLVLFFLTQEEAKNLEMTKASLAQELVNLSNRIEDLEADSEELKKLTKSYKASTKKILQL